MERSAKALTHAICSVWSNATPIVVFARTWEIMEAMLLLLQECLTDINYKVRVYLFNINGHLSEDLCRVTERELLTTNRVESFFEIKQEFDPPKLESDTLVIDGLFGSGLNKPLTGGFASLVKYINTSPAKGRKSRYSIGIDD